MGDPSPRIVECGRARNKGFNGIEMLGPDSVAGGKGGQLHFLECEVL
jgi:hypothetical protein